MKIRGRNISNWWFLAFGIFLVVASPIFLIGFFAANNFAGAIFGPPAIWDTPRETPKRDDLIGQYSETKRTWNDTGTKTSASVSLLADGTMTVHALPMDWPDSCLLSGSGRWNGPRDLKLSLTLTLPSTDNTCKLGEYEYIALAGHSKPYRLYWVIGDPDSGTGVWMARKP
jgi:hypothetical protein